MNKRATFCNFFAFIFAIVIAGASGFPIVSYAANSSNDYENAFRRGTSLESFYEYMDNQKKKKQEYSHLYLNKMSDQLYFLEEYGEVNTEKTNMVLSAYHEILPQTEECLVFETQKNPNYILRLNWYKLRMDRFTAVITPQQYVEKLSAMIEKEMKRHDNAEATFANTDLKVLFEYCTIMFESDNDKALEEVWKRSYMGYGASGKGNNSQSIYNWYMHHDLAERPWCSPTTEDDYNKAIWVALDTPKGSSLVCRVAADGTIFYPIIELFEALLFSENMTDSPEKLSLSTSDGTVTIEMQVGSNIVRRNGEEFTLAHPVKDSFYVSGDFFDECYPQLVITQDLTPRTEQGLPVNGRILQADPFPGTNEQLTFALGLAAPINLFNLGQLDTPSNALYFDREKMDWLADLLVPVYCVPRYYRNHSGHSMRFVSGPVQSIRDKVLPRSWGVFDRASLLQSISGLINDGGHNKIYLSVVEMSKNPSDPALISKYEGITADEIAEIVEMYRWHLERWQLPDSGIAAWDISRAVQLTQWGTLCGYITPEESSTLQLQLAKIAQDNYSSWEEFGNAYLAGYEMFLGSPETAPSNTEIAPEMGDRTYIISEIYKGNQYRGVAWDLDLTPLPPREPEPLPESESLPPAESSSAVEPQPQPIQQNPVAAVAVTIVCLAVLAIVAVVIVMRRRKANVPEE